MKTIIVTTVVLAMTSVSYSATIPDFPFVYARGEATVELPPDTAKVKFQFESFNENSSNAVAEIERKSLELISFLKKQGFDKGALTSHELGKRIVRERQDYTELKILGYEVSREFELTIDDLQKYQTTIKVLFETDGATHIGVQFDRKDKQKIKADLLAQACANARRSAEAMATGFDRELGDVHCVSELGFGFMNMDICFGLGPGNWHVNGDADIAVGGALPKIDFNFVPSTITFESTVTVIFKLKDK